MISKLLSRWLKPPFYVCEWKTVNNSAFTLHMDGEFPCFGETEEDATKDAGIVISRKLGKGLQAIYTIRPATLRERLK